MQDLFSNALVNNLGLSGWMDTLFHLYFNDWGWDDEGSGMKMMNTNQFSAYPMDKLNSSQNLLGTEVHIARRQIEKSIGIMIWFAWSSCVLGLGGWQALFLSFRACASLYSKHRIIMDLSGLRFERILQNPSWLMESWWSNVATYIDWYCSLTFLWLCH